MRRTQSWFEPSWGTIASIVLPADSTRSRWPAGSENSPGCGTRSIKPAPADPFRVELGLATVAGDHRKRAARAPGAGLTSQGAPTIVFQTTEFVSESNAQSATPPLA